MEVGFVFTLILREIHCQQVQLASSLIAVSQKGFGETYVSADVLTGVNISISWCSTVHRSSLFGTIINVWDPVKS